ncbi:MAG TPA: hypothetical protein EYG89_05205 [Bacteroidia bacterium]|nr:hypothetical protein [Bacteroidia bacterium]
MENYNKHNDLISNFFYLVKKNYTLDIHETLKRFSTNAIIEEFGSIQDFQPYNYLDYMDETDLNKSLSVEEFEQHNLPNEIKELKEIVSIVELRIENNNLFKEHESLLLSRYFIRNWKAIIKEEVEKEIKRGNNLEQLKNRIISILKEIEYRTNSSYTLNIESALLYYYSYSTNDIIKLMANSINDDIDWVENLTRKNIRNQKIVLDENASKNDFIKYLKSFLKTDRFLAREKNYQFKNKFENEITNFINTICSYNDSDNIVENFNLSFIPKGRNNINILNFSKVFYYAKFKGIIKSSQGEINKILSHSFNISERYFENITKNTITKELENKRKTEDFIVKVLKPFEKRSN